MGKIAWLGGVAAMMVAGAAYAGDFDIDGNAANGEKIFKNGKGGATACFTCHGDNGQGSDALGAPRLASQGDFYVYKQLKDFEAGRRTPAGTGAVMPIFAKALSDQDKRDVAAYVHSLPDVNEPVSDLKALAAQGQKIGERYKGQVIAKFGVTNKVAACASCHGFNGRGAAPVFPMIGHQRYVYLVNQLHNWRANAEDKQNKALPAFSPRANDPVVDGVGIMREIASKLTDDDINNVATYLATAPVTTNGNHRIPTQE